MPGLIVNPDSILFKPLAHKVRLSHVICIILERGAARIPDKSPADSDLADTRPASLGSRVDSTAT